MYTYTAQPNTSTETTNVAYEVPTASQLPTPGVSGVQYLTTDDNMPWVWNGVSYTPVTNSVNVGDIKYSALDTDHGGWVRLNGRPCFKLTPRQRDAALRFGMSENVIDATDRVVKQTNATLLTHGGQDEFRITPGNLPNKSIVSSISVVSVDRARGDDTVQVLTTDSTGSLDDIMQFNLGGSDVPVAIYPRFLSANAFMFLGV